ncbi:MAG: ArnT family glycosyltransferase [Phycisphaerales bacterium]
MRFTEANIADADGVHVERRRAWTGALVLVGVLLIARVVYLLWFCRYDLIEDEAFYWLWAQHPAWSYHTKGPGIAWAIWLATKVFGDSAWAVRMVGAVGGAAAGIAAAGMAIDCIAARGGARPGTMRAGVMRTAAVLAVGLMSLAPAYQATALLATIDGPYIACWMLAAWAALRAMCLGSRSAWVWLGVALGVGFLFKYTILLLLPGLALGAWMGRGIGGLRLASGWRGAMSLGAAIFALSLAPVVIWNAQHDWVTVRHLVGHLNLSGGDETVHVARKGWGYQPKWTLEFIGAQIGMIGPGIVIGFVAAWRMVRSWRANRRRATPGGDLQHAAELLLVCVALPLLVFYLLVTFIAPAQMNWPIASETTLLVAGALWLADLSRPWTGAAKHLWRTTMIFGVVTGVAMLRLDVVADALGAVWPQAAAKIPLGRIMAARPFAFSLQTQRDMVTEKTGAQPFVMTSHYGRAALLSFYLPDRPVVHCASSRTGGRIVQQDFWSDTNLDDPALLGRNAIIVSPANMEPNWKVAFDRVEKLKPLQGEHKTDNAAFVAYGFKGLPKGGSR